ncbi:thiamine phosphate synthase [Chryseobacterium chendengshani]|uniref:thiamine phosphate synthase n=1 Tax=Chryseobacterium sp. LJ668 TaxID=2864040 RepID=UPI001C68C9AB|nr:thiamine phosphate synthase [Chryseobacterium sp. LJ668]MBW8524456.1 thiamine phosphate synthase [Chryseobacterium sp. LJ668]QYK15302.1 thiamine phosphate synthase [Chryseobacterium sp. LJ668]
MKKKTIESGIYLIIDPSIEEKILFSKLNLIVKEKISAIQIWDNFNEDQNIEKILLKIHEIISVNNIPLIINNRWEYLKPISLDGVHFNEIPENIDEIKKEINRDFIVGITCNNDLSTIEYAEKHRFNYISFCSMFPSKTVNSCELVDFETVQIAKSIFSGKIFLAGGIDLNNIKNLNHLNYDGIAVVSGIMSAENPSETINNYHQKIKQ